MVSIIYMWDEKEGKIKAVLSTDSFPEDGGWQGEWYHKIIWKVQDVIDRVHSSFQTTSEEVNV